MVTTHRIPVLILQIALFVTTSMAQNAKNDDSEKVLDSVAHMGIASGKLIYTAATATDYKPAPDAGDQLQNIVKAYKSQRDTQRGTVALLDTSFEVALVGTDVVTAGESILATSGVRYVKNQALGALTSRMDADAQKVLATRISTFEKQHKLDYEQLKHLSEKQMIQQLDNLGILNDLKSNLTDDKGASGEIDKAVVRFITNTEKATLHKLSQNEAEVAKTKAELKNLSGQVQSFISDTNSQLQSLSQSLGETQAAVESAKASLGALQEETQHHAEQLAVINDFMFRRASAGERLRMLEAGYLTNQLPKKTLDDLTDATRADAKREKVMNDVSTVIATVSQFSKIASTLGFQPPEALQNAITYASTAQSAVNDVLQGNYLGAIVGVTGLFGGGQDANAAFQHQLMSYLAGQFQHINEQLKTIIEGEQKLMDGLVALSEQVADYDRILQTRLDRMEYTLDNIEGLVRNILYLPLASCKEARKDINETLDKSFATVDLRDFEQLRHLPNNVSYTTMRDCYTYLETIYGTAFDAQADPDGFSFDTLSIRYTKKVAGGMYKVSDEQQKQYYAPSNIQQFENDYKATYAFVVDAFVDAGGNGGASTNFIAMLASLALPAKTVASYKIKADHFSGKTNACATDTPLSEGMVEVLCTAPGGVPVTRTSLPQKSLDQTEGTAAARASSILKAPLMQDSLIYLAKMALYWAPIYDYSDLKNNTLFTDETKYLSEPNILPKGPRLLRGASQTLSFGISQMNLMYGDLTAKMVFSTLWDDNDGLPGSADKLSDKQKAAAGLLKNNPFLRQNVLMFAMRAAAAIKTEYAYSFALTFMDVTPDDQNPQAQLSAAFSGKIRFRNIWLTKDGSTACVDKDNKPLDDKKRAEHCYRTPRALVAGIETSLPSADGFVEGRLSYPRTLLQMLDVKDQVGNTLADYGVFESAVAKEMDLAKRKEEGRILVKALLAIQR
jgi:hypothetical protein